MPWLSLVGWNLGFNPADVSNFNPRFLLTMFTSMYVHSSLGHLVFNMIALLLLGHIFEEKVGTVRFALIYYASGIFAVFFFTLFTWGKEALLIGASGAFCGILGGFARLYPNLRVRMFMFFLLLPPMPMWLLAIIFLGLETAFAAMGGFNFVGALTGSEGQVAHAAHIGGFLFGLIIAPWVMRIEVEAPGKKKEVKTDEKELERIAITGKQKEILERIKKEDEPDVKRAWIERLVEDARCPDCGKKFEPGPKGVKCKCGFRLKY
jgi:membrane associated rhomboid family serine protease